MLVIVALANKTARLAWALMTKGGGIYRAPKAATEAEHMADHAQQPEPKILIASVGASTHDRAERPIGNALRAARDREVGTSSWEDPSRL